MPTLHHEGEMPVSASRVWAALKDSRELLPKMAPQMVASVSVVEGTGPEGSIGSVRLVKFGPVLPEGSFVKEKMTAVDREAMCLTIEEVEGGHLSMGFSKWAPTIKIVAIDDMSCKLVTDVEYEGGSEPAVEKAKEGMSKMAKGMGEYLKASGAYA